MNVNREEIYGALFAKLQALETAGTLRATSRRLKHIEQVETSDFPCGFQVQDNEQPTAMPRLPTKWVLSAEWWIYTHEPDQSAAPSSVLNPILDAVTEALDPESPLQLQTLGGRVYNASVSGTVEVIEGVLGDRALAIVPIRIVKAD